MSKVISLKSKKSECLRHLEDFKNLVLRDQIKEFAIVGLKEGEGEDSDTDPGYYSMIKAESNPATLHFVMQMMAQSIMDAIVASLTVYTAEDEVKGDEEDDDGDSEA